MMEMNFDGSSFEVRCNASPPNDKSLSSVICLLLMALNKPAGIIDAKFCLVFVFLLNVTCGNC